MPLVITEITLFRHPQTDWNEEGRYQSKSDRPITQSGTHSCLRLVQAHKEFDFDLIISSEQSHAVFLAQSLASTIKLNEGIQKDARWAEVNHGKWEGLTYEQVRKAYPDEARKRFGDTWEYKLHQGECLKQVWGRISEAWDSILFKYSGKKIAVVTHKTPIQLFLCKAQKLTPDNHWQFEVDNCSSTRITYDSKEFTVTHQNKTY